MKFLFLLIVILLVAFALWPRPERISRRMSSQKAFLGKTSILARIHLSHQRGGNFNNIDKPSEY